MAAPIIIYDQTKNPLAEALAALRGIRDSRERLVRAVAAMQSYRDGADNPGDPSNYDALQAQCSYGIGDYASDDAAARTSFKELESVSGKLTTNAEITGMLDAVNQACALHGI